MKIVEIENKRVRISSHSITTMNDDGKTCGVVRGVRPFKELRPADSMKYFHKLHEFGVFGNSEFLKCFIICDNEPYFLHNLRPIEIYERMFKGKEGWDREERKYNERKQVAERMSELAIVIPCYVM